MQNISMSFFSKKSPGIVLLFFFSKDLHSGFSFFSSNKKSTGPLFSGLPPKPSKEEQDYLDSEGRKEKLNGQQENMPAAPSTTLPPAPKAAPPPLPPPKSPSVAPPKRLPKLPSLSFNMFQRKAKDVTAPTAEVSPPQHKTIGKKPIAAGNSTIYL